MYRVLAVIAVIVLISPLGCDKVDQAFETVEKARALKNDIEKTADEVKKDLIGKAEKIKDKARNEVGKLPYLDQKEEKESFDDEKKGERGERGKRH